MMRLAACTLPLLLVLLVAPARADEPGGTSARVRAEERAGREVLRLLAAGDRKGLARLAVGTKPADPWMTADWLLSQGEDDGAQALARAASKHAATRKLPKYVAAQRGRRGDAAARAALARAVQSIEAGKLADAYAPLEKLNAQDVTVLTVQIHFARGIALYVLQRREACIEALKAGRERAARIGWLTMESQLLQWLAQTELERGDLLMAVAHARARVRVEDGLEGRHKQHTHALLRLAKALRSAGGFDEALEVAERGLAVRRKADDRHGTAQMLILMGTIAAAAEDYEHGIAYSREGLALYEELGDAPGIADALIAVGAVYDWMDEYQQAKTFLKRAVGHSKRTGQEHYHARALSHLGTVHTSQGEYPEALKCFNASLAHDRAHKDNPRIAVNLNNLAVLYEELGDLPRARKLLRETLKLFEQANDQQSIASVCVNLGILARYARDWDTAAALLHRAARIRRMTSRVREIASVESALGALASDRGNYAEAVGLYREAIRLYGDAHDRGKLAITQANLGMALHRLGEDEEALRLLEGGLVEATAIRNPKLEVMIRENLSLLHLEMGHAEQALATAEGALLAMEYLLGGLAEEESVKARTQHTRIFEIGALAALQRNASAKVLRFLEAGRAGSLLESLGGRDALRYTTLSAALEQEERAAVLAETKAAAQHRRALRVRDRKLIQKTAATLTAATERVRDVVAKIQREGKAQADLAYPRPASLSEMQRRVAKDEALVVYGFCQDKGIAVVLGHESVRALELGSKDEIERACGALAKAGDAKAHASALAAVRSLLVKPLGLGGSVQTLLVSPSGVLCYTPFGLLFDLPVVLTPSATTNALLRTYRERPGEGVLALGDPAYPDATSSAGEIYTRGGLLTRLPSTRKEAQDVGDVVLLGPEASESGFRASIKKHRRWRAVHLACHGRVDRERPTLCALALTPDEQSDGFLTAHEVLRMDIPADLAVLSACETGTGRVVYGEGIVGLTRAFMYAGAPRVLCSLWKVDDAATQALMTRFYELWNPRPDAAASQRPKQGDGTAPKGLSAAAALRQAQAYVRSHEKWRAPHYWAAWVLWGLPD